MLAPIIELGVRMDFGLDRLIEMIEERIGRPAANAVLYVLTFSVLAWGLKTLGSFCISVFTYAQGLFLYFRGAKAPKFTSSDALHLLYDLAIFAVLWIVFVSAMTILRRHYQKKIDAHAAKTSAELKEIIADARAAVTESENQARAKLDEIVSAYDAHIERNRDEARVELEESRQAIQRYREQIETYTALVDTAKREAARLGLTSPDPPNEERDSQSPPGTGVEKQP